MREPLRGCAIFLAMPKYRVTINGRNYLIPVDEDVKRMGFYKTYFLEAENPADAENSAVQRIIDDPKWNGKIHNTEDDRPMMFLESIAEIETFHEVPSREQGYVLYPEDGSD